MSNAPQFGRLITAMITPFTPTGGVNLEEAQRIANWLIEQGTETLEIAGTTGESPTLAHEEEAELFRTMVAAVKGRAKVIAGTGSNATSTAIKATQMAEALGVDGVLQVVPYYNRPSQEGLFQHFKAVAQNTNLPIMLYNIPGRTGRNLEPETVSRLTQFSNIVAIKEAAGNVEQVKKLRILLPAYIDIYSGDDALTLDFMEQGACGVVSVASHCAGPQIREMIDAYSAGDKTTAYQINQNLKPLFDGLFMTTNPAPVKAAMEMMGFHPGGLRLPLVELTSEEKDRLKAILVQTGVISVPA